jgi:hypothetical protein
MDYPINFDFGKHWQEKIVPYLNNPDLKKSIRKGVNDHLRIFAPKKKYRANTAPASYSPSYQYITLIARKKELLVEQLRKEGRLPKGYLRLEKHFNEVVNDTNDLITELDDRLSKVEKIIFKPYLGWHAVKHNLESYVLFNGHHSWAPTFELTLAKLVEPSEEWYVRIGQHSTVINRSHTKAFDLLTWATDRIENYMFGDPLKLDVIGDTTLGGKEAFIDSL